MEYEFVNVQFKIMYFKQIFIKILFNGFLYLNYNVKKVLVGY